MFLMFLSSMTHAELILLIIVILLGAQVCEMYIVHLFFSLYVPHTPIFWCLIKDGAKWCGTCMFELWWTVEGSQFLCVCGYVWDSNLIETSLVCSKVTGCHSTTTWYVCSLHPAENLSNSEHTTLKALFIHFRHFCDCFTWMHTPFMLMSLCCTQTPIRFVKLCFILYSCGSPKSEWVCQAMRHSIFLCF
jgi:hypothetical protein